MARVVPGFLSCLVLALGGCGDESEGEGTTSSPDTTPDAAVARVQADAEEVCRRSSKRFYVRLSAIAARYEVKGITETDIESRSPLAQDLERDLEPIMPQLQAMVEGLRRVPPPPGHEAAVDEILDEYERVADRFVASPLLATDPSLPQSIDEVEAEHGFEICPDAVGP